MDQELEYGTDAQCVCVDFWSWHTCLIPCFRGVHPYFFTAWQNCRNSAFDFNFNNSPSAGREIHSDSRRRLYICHASATEGRT